MKVSRYRVHCLVGPFRALTGADAPPLLLLVRSPSCIAMGRLVAQPCGPGIVHPNILFKGPGIVHVRPAVHVSVFPMRPSCQAGGQGTYLCNVSFLPLS